MIDLEKIKNRIKKLENPNFDSDSNIEELKKIKWLIKCEKGETVQYKVRIVPTPDGDPVKNLFFHYNVGKTVICPSRNYGKKCPICEFATAQWRLGTPASQELAKKLFAQERFMVPVLVREDLTYKNENDEEVRHNPRWWSFGKKVYSTILKHLLQPEEYGDITHPQEGFDYNVSYSMPLKRGPNSFPSTEIDLARKSTPLSKDKKEIERLLTSIPDLEEIWQPQTTKEVQEILDVFLEEPEEVGDQRYINDSSNDSSEEKVLSLDEAAEALMSN